MEGSFANGLVIPGDEITFTRTKIVATGLCPNTTYEITHPYGLDLVTTNASGQIVANKAGATIDTGCAGAPCNFAEALSGRVFGGFLRWDPAVAPQAPLGYLGDAGGAVGTPHTVVGSPYIPEGGTGPANFFRVVDHATGQVIAQTDLFTVSGKVAGPWIAPTLLAFGSQAIGTPSAPLTVKVTNWSLASVTLGAAAMSGPNGSDFAAGVATDACSGQTLAPGFECTIQVIYTPAAIGAGKALLTLTHSASTPALTVDLTGAGFVPVPIATVSPASLIFATALGTTSASQAVTVTNTGAADLTVTGVTVTGANASDFAATNGCATVAPGGSCQVTVTFTPATTGTHTATLGIADNDPSSSPTVSLSGAAVIPIASVSPASISFANTIVGQASSVPVTVTNTGTANLVVGTFAVSGANAGDFSAVNSVASPCGTVTPGASCQIQVTFSPTARGLRAATLSIADNASNSPQTVALSGTGLAPVVTVSPTSITFASTAIGQTASAAVLVTNGGNANLTVTGLTLTGANPGDFRASGCAAAVLPGGSCTITVVFAPTAIGARAATLSIADNAPGSPQAVALSGNGLGTSVTVSPASLSFASAVAGTTTASQRITVTNSGNANLVIGGVALGGANPLDFIIVTNGCARGTTVAPGANCAINVAFKPTGIGTRNGSVTISDNASNSPQSVPLTGTGTETLAITSATATLKVSKGVTTASWSVNGTTNYTNGNTITLRLNAINGPLIGSNKPGGKGTWSVNAGGSSVVPKTTDIVYAISAAGQVATFTPIVVR